MFLIFLSERQFHMRQPLRIAARKPKIIFPFNLAREVKQAHILRQHHLGLSRDEVLDSMSTFKDTPLAASDSADQIQEIGSQSSDILEPEAEQLFPRTLGVAEEDQPSVPSLFTRLPSICDSLRTSTSLLQDETAQECLLCHAGTNGTSVEFQYFNGHGSPALARHEHIEFLHDSLNKLPAGFVVLDASRTWMIYWALTGLCLLGEDISPYRKRY